MKRPLAASVKSYVGIGCEKTAINCLFLVEMESQCNCENEGVGMASENASVPRTYYILLLVMSVDKKVHFKKERETSLISLSVVGSTHLGSAQGRVWRVP